MAKRKFTAEPVGEWGNLPDDILTKILSHLFGKDYTCFLSVCRSWRSAPPPLRSIPNPFSTTSEANRYPSLFHFSGNSSKCNFYDPFYNGSYVAQIPEELIDARIFFSNYGWLLMSLKTQLFFFEPFTKQRIDLRIRYLPSLQECGRMCFTSPPTSPDCMVFGIDGDSKDGCYIATIRRGQTSWKVFHYKELKASFFSSHSNPVFYKGAFYSLTIDGKLGVFDPKKIRQGRLYCWKIIDELNYPCESIQENFLVESNGELISICIGRIAKYVRVFRLNYDYDIRWEEVHSLGDIMIFVSRTGCTSMQTHTMGNTIYFPGFNSGGNGRFYSLTSRKFHTVGLALARNDLYDMKRMFHCAWITLNTSEFYTEDELRWFRNREKFIPSRGRVKVKGAPSAHPSFILTDRVDSNNQLFFNMFDSCHNVEVIPEVRQMRTATCAFGWLFQVDPDYSDCLLLNPQTMEKIHLPKLPDIFNICAISSSPNDPNCIVLLMHYEANVSISFSYCRPGDVGWTMVKVLDKPEDVNSSFNESKNSTNSDSDNGEEEVELEDIISDTITNLIGYQGKIYGLMWAGILAKIEFEPMFKLKRCDYVCLPRACYFGMMEHKNYMVESCGELFVVQINSRDDSEVDGRNINPSKILEVEVFKLDFTRKEWEKVGCLGENIAFFCYGPSCCISSSSMETGKGNSIYFIGCFSDDESIYTFDLEDGSISSSLAFPEVDVADFQWTALTLS